MITIPRSHRAAWRLAIVAFLSLGLVVSAVLELSGGGSGLLARLGLRSDAWIWLLACVQFATATALVIPTARTPVILAFAAVLVMPLVNDLLSARPTIVAGALCVLASAMCIQLDRREKEVRWMRHTF